MRLHRFIIGQNLASGKMVIADPALCHQWMKVLRLGPGDRVVLCDGRGREAEAAIESLDAKQAVISCAASTIVASEPQRGVTLACAVLKRENFELVLQKATECGVQSIVPLLTQRTVKTGLKMDRLERIAREAAEQSGRGIVPEIQEPMALNDFLKSARHPVIFFHNGKSAGVQDCKSAREQESTRARTSCNPAILQSCNPQHTTLIIGPEGGWMEEEVEAARAAGCLVQSLGPLTLRAETAAIGASYLAVHSPPPTGEG